LVVLDVPGLLAPHAGLPMLTHPLGLIAEMCERCDLAFTEFRARMRSERRLCKGCQEIEDEELHGIDPETRRCRTCGEVEA
jgi:hypothetical protein